MLRAVLSRIFGTFHRRQLDDEFDEEVREHLNMLVERFIARGMDPAFLRRAAAVRRGYPNERASTGAACSAAI